MKTKLKNVTVSMEESVLAEARVKAAQAGKSLSRYMADLVVADTAGQLGHETPRTRNAQLEALERILSGPKWSVMRDGRMPTSDERNER
jgi:hypothetical protein